MILELIGAPRLLVPLGPPHAGQLELADRLRESGFVDIQLDERPTAEARLLDHDFGRDESASRELGRVLSDYAEQDIVLILIHYIRSVGDFNAYLNILSRVSLPKTLIRMMTSPASVVEQNRLQATGDPLSDSDVMEVSRLLESVEYTSLDWPTISSDVLSIVVEGRQY